MNGLVTILIWAVIVAGMVGALPPHPAMDVLWGAFLVFAILQIVFMIAAVVFVVWKAK